jgi:transcriptional regulator with XRE-family HTH domain
MAAGIARGEAATAEQIAIYGSVAAKIRAAMAARGWTPADFNEAMGRDRSNGAIYHWMACKGAPGIRSRAEVAKILGLKEADLIPHEEGDGRAVVVKEQGRRDDVMPPTPPLRDVLSFTINSEGMARLKCDVTLPAVKGASLLQILLNAGLVMAEGAAE